MALLAPVSGIAAADMSASELVPMPPDNTVEEVLAGIDRVAAKAKEWAELEPQKKKDLFEKCLHNLEGEMQNLLDAACASRGYDPRRTEHGHLVGDAAIVSIACSAGWIRTAVDFYDTIIRTGKPPQGSEITPRPDGSTRVTMLPRNLKETMVADTGCAMVVPCGKAGRCEIVVRGEPRQFDPLKLPPAVAGILGAGNTDIPNDIVDPMVKENSVVVYKSNPVMARGAEVKRRIFKPLIDAGYLAMFHGGLEHGKAIVDSPKIDKLGCTGAVGTHDKIVWGNQDKNDPKAQPIMNKPFLSELGSVNPYIVVPGDWSAKDIEHQAKSLIAYKMQNGGHICASPQVVITCKNWPQREQFIKAVKKAVQECQAMAMWYPGTQKAYDQHKVALGDGPDVTVQSQRLFGDASAPLLFKAGVSPHSADQEALPMCFCSEAFSPILVEVPLDVGPTFDGFLPAAVDFATDRCWGTLTASIVIDDATKGRNQDALDRIIDGMKFGCVGVNVPPSMANAFAQLSWGGFPGHTQRDVQSGIGHLGNFGCYENVEKTVMQGRFTNMLQFSNSGSPDYQKKRLRKLAEVLVYMSHVSIVKFAVAHFLGC